MAAILVFPFFQPDVKAVGRDVAHPHIDRLSVVFADATADHHGVVVSVLEVHGNLRCAKVQRARLTDDLTGVVHKIAGLLQGQVGKQLLIVGVFQVVRKLLLQKNISMDAAEVAVAHRDGVGLITGGNSGK